MKTKALIIGFVMLTGTPILAQAADRNWYVAPSVSVSINDSDRAKNTGFGTGVAIGKSVNDQWNVELAGQYLSFDGSKDEQGQIGVDGLYFFNRNTGFAPYAIVGLGWAHEGPGNNNLIAKGGLGFTTQINKGLDFRADARYQWHANHKGSSLGDWVLTAGVAIPF